MDAVAALYRELDPLRPITRLLTGHKGSGKTTELNRVASALHSGHGGKKVFVSTLYAHMQPWQGTPAVSALDDQLRAYGLAPKMIG